MATYREVMELASIKGYLPSDRFLNDNGFRSYEWESEEVQLLELTLMQRWLLNEHGLFVFADPVNDFSCWTPSAVKKGGTSLFIRMQSFEFITHDTALLYGIHQALKLI